MSSILKSSALIKSIKTRGFIPESQETFTAETFLEIATEKTNISLMAKLMEARGDYLVYYQDFPIIEGVYEYDIPSRAHGDKLREASIVDAFGETKNELTQIDVEELTDYQSDYSVFGARSPFYVQNNTLILINKNYTPDSFLRMFFYMRPNKLVVENRAATASAVSSSVEVDSVTPKTGAITEIATTGVLTSVGHGLKGGSKVFITGTDSDPSVDGVHTITVIDSDHFSISALPTVAGVIGSFQLATEVLVVSSVNFPKHFTPDTLFDVVQCISPNKIKLYDLQANNVNNNQKTISFRVSDITKKGKLQILKGDYITKSEETIVPNIPTEFHPLLAQMVSVACMEGMADENAKKSAMTTLAEMERDILKITSNRVEGAPKKIKNRNGTLTQAVKRGYRR